MTQLPKDKQGVARLLLARWTTALALVLVYT